MTSVMCTKDVVEGFHERILISFCCLFLAWFVFNLLLANLHTQSATMDSTIYNEALVNCTAMHTHSNPVPTRKQRTHNHTVTLRKQRQALLRCTYAVCILLLWLLCNFGIVCVYNVHVLYTRTHNTRRVYTRRLRCADAVVLSPLRFCVCLFQIHRVDCLGFTITPWTPRRRVARTDEHAQRVADVDRARARPRCAVHVVWLCARRVACTTYV